MDNFRAKLEVIRKKLLFIFLKRELRIYIKRRRERKSAIREHVIRSIESEHMESVVRIQRAARLFLARKKKENMASILIKNHRILQDLYVRKYVSKSTRGKEIYWL